MADISILGCGWLGLPLAERLIADGHTVKGSTTRAERMPLLEKAGIRPFHISAGPSAFSGFNADFLKTDILILTLPPRRGEGGYLATIAALLPDITKAGIEKILFTSSISVYGNATGRVTEETPVRPDTASATEIVAVEDALREAFPLTTVLRLGGLTGPDRHPITSLAGRANIADGDAPINLVHLDDCIGIAHLVIHAELWGEIFNVVPPYHPPKGAYYVRKAAERQLPLPSFLPGGHDARVVDGSKISGVAGYRYAVIETL